MKKLKPKPHQIQAENWKKNKNKVILALDMGLGKSMLGARSIKETDRALIICPATLKMNWLREVKTWAVKTPINIIKKKSEDLPKGPGITIINYDLLGKKVKKRAVANYDFKDFDIVIVDEAHYLKNAKSVRSKIAGKIVFKTPRAILLSGTIMERAIDLYVPLYSVGALGKMPYHTFGMKFGDPKQVHLGTRTVWQYRGLTNSDELKKIMEPYVLVMKKEDVIDLPDKTINVVGLDLPISRREKSYDFNQILKDPRPIAFEGLAELLHEQGLRKLPLAIQHIKLRMETEHKVLVTAKHTDIIDTLKEKLESFNPVVIDGRVKDKQPLVDKFQNDKSVRICIGQTKAISEGHNLTAARHVIIVEPDWSYSILMQIIDRCHRIGQKDNVTAELLTISQSIDERVLYTTLEKKQYQKELGL